MPWLVQFLYQGAFFVVICFVTGLQIYPLFKIWYLITPIVLIMAMGALGLYLEVLEFLGDCKLYLRYEAGIGTLSAGTLANLKTAHRLL
jgi:hypothetical protein